MSRLCPDRGNVSPLWAVIRGEDLEDLEARGRVSPLCLKTGDGEVSAGGGGLPVLRVVWGDVVVAVVTSGDMGQALRDECMLFSDWLLP